MAGSIELFSFNRKYCQVVGINHQPTINSRNWIFINSFVPFGLSSAAFLVFEANSMLEYGISFLATSIAVFLMCIYLAMIRQMTNIWQFIKNCEQFIEKKENSIIAYRELIEKIERLSKFVGIAAVITLIIATLPFLLHSLIKYYILDLGEESFFLLYPMKWPFDWKTPLRYFVAWLAQFAGLIVSILTFIIFLNMVFGSCWLFMFMAENITKDVAAFNIDVKKNENCADWTKRFSDIVQIYSDAKERVNEFNAIAKYSLCIAIFYIMISVSSTLLTLQFQLLDENAKLFEIFIELILVLWIFGPLFLICELGERMTYHFDMFRKELERCDWHELPIELQRMYVIFLSDTQQPKNIACFGNNLCIRDSFKKITKTGFSYFMALRKFEA